MVRLLLLMELALASFAQVSPTINVRDYGSAGDGVHDDTAAINRAINAIPSSGAVLYFPCGTFLISGGLTAIQISYVTVTGPSNDCATIKASGAASYIALHMGNQSGLSDPVSLAHDAPLGSSSFTLTPGGLTKLAIGSGDYLLIQNAGWASEGPGSPLIPSQQAVKVTSTSGDTATIEGTLSQLFTAARCANPPAGECGGSVRKFKPVTGSAILHLAIDGSANTGEDTTGLVLNYAVNSTIAYMKMSKFLGTRNSGGFALDTGYNNSLHDVVCNQCANGGGGGGDGVTIQRESYANVQNVSVTQVATQSVFSFSIRETHFSTLQNINIDAGGANGRVFKTLRSSHNIVNNLVAKNGAGGHNGINVTDISAYNIFNNCVTSDNDAKGIALFGNHNEYNTFNNCTAKNNVQAAFGQFAAFDNTATDYHTAIVGGIYCCQRGPRNTSSVLAIVSDHFQMTGASVFDDNGAAQNGLVLDAADGAIAGSAFSGFPAKRDIFVKGSLNSFATCGNQVPDQTTPPLPQQICGFDIPAFKAGALLNGASFLSGAAPGALLTVFGTGLSTGNESTASKALPFAMQGTEIFVNGVASALSYVSPIQVNFQIPDSTLPGPATVVITVNGQSAAQTFGVNTVAPGIFMAGSSTTGPPAANAIEIAADGTQTSVPVAACGAGTPECSPVPIPPAPVGGKLILVLYATGVRHFSSLNAVSASIGGTSAPVIFAGSQAQFAGVDQINVLVPPSLKGRGAVDVIVTVDGVNSNPVRLNFE